MLTFADASETTFTGLNGEFEKLLVKFPQASLHIMQGLSTVIKNMDSGWTYKQVVQALRDEKIPISIVRNLLLTEFTTVAQHGLPKDDDPDADCYKPENNDDIVPSEMYAIFFGLPV